MVPNAPPMMMPTAISTTFPRIADFLNSSIIAITIRYSLLGLLTAQQGQQTNPAPPKRSEGHVPLFDAFDQALWLW